jgi:hypothetical protein
MLSNQKNALNGWRYDIVPFQQGCVRKLFSSFKLASYTH